jgi:hypothetical protein
MDLFCGLLNVPWSSRFVFGLASCHLLLLPGGVLAIIRAAGGEAAAAERSSTYNGGRRVGRRMQTLSHSVAILFALASFYIKG